MTSPKHGRHGKGDPGLGQQLALPAVLGVLLQHLVVPWRVKVKLKEGRYSLDVAHCVDQEHCDAGGDVGKATYQDHAEAEAKLEPGQIL